MEAIDQQGWPIRARFQFGDSVQRCNLKSGAPPAYRFPGRICGWYLTPSESLGFAVSNMFEPACIQVFPQSGLEHK